jgi:hypothetical protein
MQIIVMVLQNKIIITQVDYEYPVKEKDLLEMDWIQLKILRSSET